MIKALKKVYDKLKKIYYDRLFMEYSDDLSAPSESEKILITELREEYTKIPVIDVTGLSGAELNWSNNMNRLHELVLNDEPRRFLQWDVIGQTMAVGNVPYVLKEQKSLMESPLYNSIWRQVITESEIGTPLKSRIIPNSSANLVHLAYHLQQFTEKTAISIDKLGFIFEFGGGYGAMCKLAFSLGFKKKYVIFDLPAFSSLQKYYLKAHGYKILTLDTFSKEETGVLCVSDLSELQTVIDISKAEKDKLFIATWSISETPLKLRSKIVPMLDDFTNFLIAYQNGFEEIDNVNYFKNFSEKYQNLKWLNWGIAHIPFNNYLVGSNKIVQK